MRPPAAPPPFPRAAASTLDAWIVAALAVVFVVFVAQSWGKWPLLTADSARELYVPFQIRQGAVIYRDFYYLYGPVAPYSQAGLLALFGDHLTVLYTASVIQVAVIAALLYALARHLLAPAAAGAVVWLVFSHFALGKDIWGYFWPYAFAATFAMVWGVGLLLGLARYLATRRCRWLVLAGVACGLSVVTKLEFGVAAVGTVAGFSALAWGDRLLPGRGPWPWRDALALLVPIPLVAGAIAAAVLWSVPLAVVLESVWPTALMKAWNSQGTWLGTVGTWRVNLKQMALAGTLLAAIAGLVPVIARLRTPGRERWLVAAAVSAVLALLVAWTTLWTIELPTLLFHWMGSGYLVLFGLLAVVAVRWVRAVHAETSPSPLLVLWGVVGCYGCLVMLRTLMSGYNEYTGYQAPVAVIAWVALASSWLPGLLDPRDVGRVARRCMLGGLVLGLGGYHFMVKWALYQVPHAPVTSAVGTVWADPTFAGPFNQALAFVAARIQPGDALLAAPMEASFYLFSGHPCVVMEDQLFFGYLPTAAAQADFIRRLEARQVRFVVLSNYGYGEKRFGKAYMQDLAHWIDHACRPLATFGSTAYHLQVFETPFARPR